MKYVSKELVKKMTIENMTAEKMIVYHANADEISK
jgi:hypothetical protein